MRKQFAVYDDGTMAPWVHFEGSTAEVYAWLRRNSILDAPGRKVVDRFTSVSWEEGVFMREYEEKQKEVALIVGNHLSEERIRTIVREELSNLLDAARAKTAVPEYYDTEKMEDALIAIIKYLSEHEANEAVNKHEDHQHGGGYS